eukprot:7384526-Prymnesium_polylepis.5
MRHASALYVDHRVEVKQPAARGQRPQLAIDDQLLQGLLHRKVGQRGCERRQHPEDGRRAQVQPSPKVQAELRVGIHGARLGGGNTRRFDLPHVRRLTAGCGRWAAQHGNGVAVLLWPLTREALHD